MLRSLANRMKHGKIDENESIATDTNTTVKIQVNITTHFQHARTLSHVRQASHIRRWDIPGTTRRRQANVEHRWCRCWWLKKENHYDCCIFLATCTSKATPTLMRNKQCPVSYIWAKIVAENRHFLIAVHAKRENYLKSPAANQSENLAAKAVFAIVWNHVETVTSNHRENTVKIVLNRREIPVAIL